MHKPKHLDYLSQPLDWYTYEHSTRQVSMQSSRSGPPAYNLDQLLKRNKSREYKGVHPFCAAEEIGEILTCVIFKRADPIEYFHTLYLGPETQEPEKVHNLIMERLDLTENDLQKSLVCRFQPE